MSDVGYCTWHIGRSPQIQADAPICYLMTPEALKGKHILDFKLVPFPLLTMMSTDAFQPLQLKGEVVDLEFTIDTDHRLVTIPLALY